MSLQKPAVHSYPQLTSADDIVNDQLFETGIGMWQGKGDLTKNKFY
jgi:hypothetical protein